jgi:hypothetical protein
MLDLKSDATFVQKLWSDMDSFINDLAPISQGHVCRGKWSLYENHIGAERLDFFDFFNPRIRHNPPIITRSSGEYSGLVWISPESTSTGESGIEVNSNTGYYLLRIKERRQIKELTWDWIDE